MIDIQDIIKSVYEQQQKKFAPKLFEYANNCEWEKFIDLALCVYEVMPIAFCFYDRIPDRMKYDFAIDAYMHHGDSVPACRKAVRGALKYGKPDLPPELKEQDEIIIYRAGEEPIEKAKYRISWTTDLKVALFFLNEWRSRHASHLYRAKIKPEHIIAYTNEREESEVMQYRHVYDLEEISADC